jgi:hypothetical protein
MKREMVREMKERIEPMNRMYFTANTAPSSIWNQR